MMKPFIIGIGGGSGSGKTTITKTLSTKLSSESPVVLSFDSYYHALDGLSADERNKKNFDQPSALDFDLISEHLLQLASGGAIDVPIYDFAIHNRVGSQRLSPSSLILVEGILALYDDRVRQNLDLSIFVDSSSETRFQRRLSRDQVERGRTAESVYEQWNKTVHPSYLSYCEPTKKFAELIVNGEGEIDEVVEGVVVRYRVKRGDKLGK